MAPSNCIWSLGSPFPLASPPPDTAAKNSMRIPTDIFRHAFERHLDDYKKTEVPHGAPRRPVFIGQAPVWMVALTTQVAFAGVLGGYSEFLMTSRRTKPIEVGITMPKCRAEAILGESSCIGMVSAPIFTWGSPSLVAIPLSSINDPARAELSAAEMPVSGIQCFRGFVRGLDRVGSCLPAVPLSWVESMGRA